MTKYVIDDIRINSYSRFILLENYCSPPKTTFSFTPAFSVNNKIKTLLDGVMNELREMRDEIKSLKENKTIGQGR